MEQQVVVFELGSEFFGVGINSVESIIKMQAITKIPHAPVFVQGVTNLRGKVLPVIDLRTRFGLPAKEISSNNRIMIIGLDSTEVGMIVDGVSEVLTLQDETIEPAPALSATAASCFITGIAKTGQKLVILLDSKMILSNQEIESLTQTAVA
jgi:purine-binding chemotaxis protein CheW